MTVIQRNIKVTEPILVVHASQPLKKGTPGMVLEDPTKPTAIGYRERQGFFIQQESRALQLLERKVAPRGIYTNNYVGPGAYVPVEGSITWLPLVSG